jgi:EmrB/QacA subfamily drug resistance transporter
MADEDGGVAAGPGEAAGGHAHPRRWAILVAVCAALLVIVLDNTVLNVALPSIADEFGASAAEQQAVLDAYVVVFAGLLIAAGAASDRYGRRRVMLCGMAVLAVSSAAATVAWSVWWLIAMRAVMGLGAALTMPATLAVLVQVFPEDERPRAFAVWGAVASGAMAAGPVLGGALVSGWSWAGVFLINVLLVGWAAAAVLRLVPESRDHAARPVDGVSAGLVTLGMTALTTAVIGTGGATGGRTEGHGLGDGLGGLLVPGAFVVAAGALSAFVRRQRRASAPLADLSLYRDRRFSGGSAAATLLTLGTGSSLFLLAGYLQGARGYSALESGLAVVPLAVGLVLGSAAGGRAPAGIGARTAIVTGFSATAGGFCVLAGLGLGAGYWVAATGLALAGLGTGFAGPSTTTVVLAAVPRGRAGMGSALNDTHQQVGVALGVAGLGALHTALRRAGLDEAPALSATFLVSAACAAAGALVAGLTLGATRKPPGAGAGNHAGNHAEKPLAHGR